MIPDNFVFIIPDREDSRDFTAWRVGNYYLVSWDKDYKLYERETVEGFVRRRKWNIIEFPEIQTIH